MPSASLSMLLYWLPMLVLDVIKHCDHPRWYEKNTSRSCLTFNQMLPTINCRSLTSNQYPTSSWRFLTSNQRTFTTNQRSGLRLEVPTPSGGAYPNWRSFTSNQRCLTCTCRYWCIYIKIFHSFWKKSNIYYWSSNHLSTRWNINLLRLCLQIILATVPCGWVLNSLGTTFQPSHAQDLPLEWHQMYLSLNVPLFFIVEHYGYILLNDVFFYSILYVLVCAVQCPGIFQWCQLWQWFTHICSCRWKVLWLVSALHLKWL